MGRKDASGAKKEPLGLQPEKFPGQCSGTASWISSRVRGPRGPASITSSRFPSNAASVEKADAVPVTLLLGGLMTSHLYREDRIVYGHGAEQLGTYEFERWAEPPAELIQGVLLRQMRASGRYPRRVLPAQQYERRFCDSWPPV